MPRRRAFPQRIPRRRSARTALRLRDSADLVLGASIQRALRCPATRRLASPLPDASPWRGPPRFCARLPFRLAWESLRGSSRASLLRLPACPPRAGGRTSLRRTHRSLLGTGNGSLHIAATGYHADPVLFSGSAHYQDFAFFPIWPIAIRLASLGFLPMELAGGILSNVLWIAAMVPALAVLRRITHDEGSARRGLLLLALGPAAYVGSLVYSEALFVLIASMALVQLGHPIRGPLLTIGAQLTRLTGSALSFAVLAASVHARRRSVQGLLTMIAGPAAFVAWIGFVWWLTGEPLGYLRGSPDWYEQSGTEVGLLSMLHGLDGAVRLLDRLDWLGACSHGCLHQAAPNRYRHGRVCVCHRCGDLAARQLGQYAPSCARGRPSIRHPWAMASEGAERPGPHRTMRGEPGSSRDRGYPLGELPAVTPAQLRSSRTCRASR